jgi:hypothetical protein
MVSFYLTFLAVLLAGVGARDQVLVARLTLARGRWVSVLVFAIVVSCITAITAVWAAELVSPMLAPRARSFFAAMALALAGLESLVLMPRREMREPTLSLGALAIALVALQLIDAARFLIFAMAIATAAPGPVALAGAIAGAGAVLAGWALPDWFARPFLRPLRRSVGLVLLLVGVFLGLRVLELI